VTAENPTALDVRSVLKRLVNQIVCRLANRFPRAYEERWAWLFPAWFVYAKLQAVKESSAVESR
jgi:hypothetical protein